MGLEIALGITPLQGLTVKFTNYTCVFWKQALDGDRRKMLFGYIEPVRNGTLMQEQKDLLIQVGSSTQLLARQQTEYRKYRICLAFRIYGTLYLPVAAQVSENIALKSCLLDLNYLLLVITQFHYGNTCFQKLLLSALLVLAGIDPTNNTISATTLTEAPSPLTSLPPARATYTTLTGTTLLPAPRLEEHIPEYILYNTPRLLRTFVNRGA